MLRSALLSWLGEDFTFHTCAAYVCPQSRNPVEKSQLRRKKLRIEGVVTENTESCKWTILNDYTFRKLLRQKAWLSVTEGSRGRSVISGPPPAYPRASWSFRGTGFRRSGPGTWRCLGSVFFTAVLEYTIRMRTRKVILAPVGTR